MRLAFSPLVCVRATGNASDLRHRNLEIVEGGGTNRSDAGPNLSGSWQQGHSAAYNTPSPLCAFGPRRTVRTRRTSAPKHGKIIEGEGRTGATWG